MSILKSRIVYGVEISGENGEVDYDVAYGVGEVAKKHGYDVIWAGRDGNPPTMVVIGKELESYNEEGTEVYVNLKELLEKEEKVKEGFPGQQIIDDLNEYLNKNGKDEIGIYDADTIILHIED